MIIPKLKISLYAIIIVLSIIIGMIYVYKSIRKEGVKEKEVLLYFIMYISFALVFGKLYTMFTSKGVNIITAGLSSYGGLIGVVIASIIFEMMLPLKGVVKKYSILSLPLVYGLSKIACFISGCCSGIPYEGLFKVKYPHMLNIWQFPIQIVETIVCLLLFFICSKYKNNKNINYIVLIFVSIIKFSLDFLRYDHVKISITSNQIFSIILLVATIIVYLFNRFKKVTE